MCDLLESQAESQYVIKIPSKTKNSFMAAKHIILVLYLVHTLGKTLLTANYNALCPGSLDGRAIDYGVVNRNPVGVRFSAHPDRPSGPQILLYNGDRVFPGGKLRPWRATDHSPPSNAAVI